MLSIFADERQYSEDPDVRAQWVAEMNAELAEIQRAEDKFMADLYGGKAEDPDEETEEEE